MFAIACVVVSLACLVWYIKKKYSYWEGQGIPYVSFTDYLSHLYNIATKPITEVTLLAYKKHGRLFGSYNMLEPVLYVAEPELIKQIMVKDFASFPDRFSAQKTGHKLFDLMVGNLSGQEWKETRDVITPAFTSGKMRQMIAAVVETSEYSVENFVKAARKKQSIDIKEKFGAYSMDIIARLAFATKLNSHENPNSEFVKNGREAFGQNASFMFTLILLFPKVFTALRITPFSNRIGEFFSNVVNKIIEQRGENQKEATDMLQLLLNAKKEDSLEKEKLSDNRGKKEVLTMDSIIAQCVLFFLAGYDTTGTTLSLIAYHLALNAEVQDRLLKEIDKVDKNEQLTYDTLNSMHYLDAVIQENFRISGNIAQQVRLCTKETEVGGVKVKPGMLIQMPIYGMQMDPEFFPEPETFKPERFLPENKDSITPYTFLPFGEGPRHCIGMRLAMMIIKVIMFKLLQRVRFVKCPETQVPLKPLPRLFGLFFKPPIKLGVVEREA